MPRFLRFGLPLALALLVLAGLVLWWNGLGTAPDRPTRQSVSDLRDSVTIQWTEAHTPILKTDDPQDALTALGYVHGLERGWMAVLWRQTALGRVGRWFGPGVTPIDRHARRIGLARHARAAYEALSRAQKTRLQAYARGMSAALRTEHVRQSDPFVLLDVTPTSWEPWHTLLIERLLAWTATTPLSAPSTAPEPVQAFCRTDHTFRRWLHLHGWNRSIAWTARPARTPDTTPPALFQRHVLGASALPIVQEVLWQRSDDTHVTWATLPGTLLFPTGSSPDAAWASLLHSPARLTRVPVDSSALRDWHERLEPKDADEQLVHVERLGNALPLARTPSSRKSDSTTVPVPSADPDTTRTVAVPDTAWAVTWPGFSSTSDLSAWMRRGHLPSPDTDDFSLFAADGLRLKGPQAYTILGTPPVTVTGPNVAVVGRSRWTRFQAQALVNHTRRFDSLAVGRWAQSDSSTWAARLVPHLEPALTPFSPRNGGVGNTATYLRNWDFNYDAQSIGALLFDEWMRAYRADLGHVPTLADTSAYFARYRLQRAFARALDTLTTRLGSDARLWRWEQRVTDRRYFPVWSADSLISVDLHDLHSTRYAPLRRTGKGHPSALGGGPSLVDPLPVGPAPDTWESWMRPGGPMTVRRHRYDPSRFFARSRLRADRPVPRSLTGEEPTHQTLLLPTPN